jgi:hypothetical protein
VVRLTFQPARCGHTLNVISKTLYSPDKNINKYTWYGRIHAKLKKSLKHKYTLYGRIMAS